MKALPTVVCVTGLAAEASVARAAGFQAVIGAGDPERTAALVAAAARGAHYLVSFGIAGALAPTLHPGDVILSGNVIAQNRNWRPADDFDARIRELAGQIEAFEGPVLGSGIILAREDAKTAAWRETGALAVDLESAV